MLPLRLVKLKVACEALDVVFADQPARRFNHALGRLGLISVFRLRCNQRCRENRANGCDI